MTKRGPTKQQAVTLAVLGLIGTLGVAAIKVLPALLSKTHSTPEPRPNTVSVSSSTVGGSVVGGNQTITVIVVQTEADLKRLTDKFSALPPDAAPQTIAALESTRKASPQPASDAKGVEDVIARRVSELSKLGFAFAPMEQTYSVEEHSVVRFLIPVTKGLEYVIVAVGAPTIGVLRGYVIDESGKPLFSDLKEAGNQAVYSFHPQNSGTVTVYLDANDIHAPSTIICTIARRQPGA